jgi:signal transduction histidine kinase
MNDSLTPRRPAGSGDRPATTRLRGWLTAGRALWIAVATLTLAVFVANLPAELASLRAVCRSAGCAPDDLTIERVREIEALGLSVEFFAITFLVAEIVFVAIWFTVGVAIFWRKSDDRAALFVALFLVTFSPAVFLAEAVAGAAGTPIWWPIVAICATGGTCFFLFFLLFPDGRFVPRWTMPLAPALFFLRAGALSFPNLPMFNWLDPFRLVPFLVLITAGVGAQAYRYRRVSSPAQRRQTRVVVVSVIAAVLVLVVAQGLSALLQLDSVLATLLTILVTYLALLLIPIAIGVAILRYQLWGIGVLASRTLVYGLLTVCVVGLYTLIVGGLGLVLQARGNLLISLVATGLVAVLFQPLRERLQRGVNRLVYGERDDPYVVLSRLGQRLERNLAPDAVLPTIVETLAGALHLPYVAIVLDQQGVVDTAASVGAPVPGALRLPLVHRGEALGQLILAPRSAGASFSPADRRLLDDLVTQAAAAAHGVRLTADLQRLTADLQQSREQLIGAREEERRRLRRDLHDGVGPTLASLSQRIETARRLVPDQPDAAMAMLADLRGQVKTTIADIRRLVYALRPPVLDELGLVSAIREYAVRHNQSGGAAVAVDAPDDLPQLPAAVEVAAYRIALEALTNVARHAGAHGCTVRLSTVDGCWLAIEIEDDGVGLPAGTQAGVGIASMRERAAELGGEFRMEALPTGGTKVRARLPLPNEERRTESKEQNPNSTV